jgi:anti-anti-sigma factor
MDFITDARDDVRVIHLIGELDVPSTLQLRNELGRVTNTPADRILLDLTEVQQIGRDGLGLLAAAARRAKQTGARLALADPHQRVGRALSTAGLEIHASVGAGAAAVART